MGCSTVCGVGMAMLNVVCCENFDVSDVGVCKCVWLLLCEDVNCCTVFEVELLQGVPTTYYAAAAAAPQNAAVFQSQDKFVKLILVNISMFIH